MTGELLVVPHGTGIGDIVNLRPLLRAVVRHHGERLISVLCPGELAWLLPTGVVPARAQGGIRFWRRPEPDHPLLSKGRHLDVGTIGAAVRLLPIRAMAQALTCALQAQGHEVISLLEDFVSLDLDTLWTRGPWTVGSRHVIDLLAGALEARSIGVPLEERAPSLRLPALPLRQRPVVVVSPTAGSRLKEPPLPFWVDAVRGLIDVGVTPLILSAPGRDTAGQIVRQAPAASVVGSSHLLHSARLLAAAHLVISPDSGILHLAAALGKQTIGLFGSTNPEVHGPYDRSRSLILSTTVQHRPVCQRCWTAQLLPEVRCPVLHPLNCLSGIDPSAVVRAARESLKY